MSPELLRECQHTKESDVYSFGIVLWELITNEKPFRDLSFVDVLTLIGNGQNPMVPDDCPDSLRKMMRNCWYLDPKKRPSFTRLIETLQQLTQEPVSEYLALFNVLS